MNTSASQEGLSPLGQGIALSPAQFEALSKSMDSDEPIKELMTKTLNLMIEAEFEVKIGAKKSEQTPERKRSPDGTKLYRCGYRTRRFDTTCGTLMLKIPHPNKGGFIPSFLKRYQRYESALRATIIDAYVSGISTGRMRSLVNSMGVEGISRGQVSRITNSINEFVETFRKRPLKDVNFPVLFIDAIFEKVRVKWHATFTAILVVSGLNELGERDILAIEAYPDESKESYLRLFTSLKERGLECPRLIVSDGAAGLTTAMAEVLPEAKWQHCKVHLIRKILRNVRVEDRQIIADELKEIWYTSHKSKALRRANKIYNKYREKYPAAMTRLKLGIYDTLTYLEFPKYSPKKISTSNVLERLNKEFRRRSKAIGVFPTINSCLKLFTLYAIKYADSWEESRLLRGQSRRVSKQNYLHHRYCPLTHKKTYYPGPNVANPKPPDGICSSDFFFSLGL